MIGVSIYNGGELGYESAFLLSYKMSEFFFRQIAVMYIELSRNTPLLVQLFFINDQDDKSDIDGAKGNETLLNWINEEIQSLKEEQFFHKDYDETLVATYGEEYKEELVVEGAKIK